MFRLGTHAEIQRTKTHSDSGKSEPNAAKTTTATTTTTTTIRRVDKSARRLTGRTTEQHGRRWHGVTEWCWGGGSNAHGSAERGGNNLTSKRSQQVAATTEIRKRRR